MCTQSVSQRRTFPFHFFLGGEGPLLRITIIWWLQLVNCTFLLKFFTFWGMCSAVAMRVPGFVTNRVGPWHSNGKLIYFKRISSAKVNLCGSCVVVAPLNVCRVNRHTSPVIAASSQLHFPIGVRDGRINDWFVGDHQQTRRLIARRGFWRAATAVCGKTCEVPRARQWWRSFSLWSETCSVTH